MTFTKKIAATPVINANIKPVKHIANETPVILLSDAANPIILKTLAPSIAGTDIINENLTANRLSNPVKSPPVIVIPDRDIPGTTAISWHSPTNSAFFGDTVFSDTSPFGIPSENNNITEFIIKNKPTILVRSVRNSILLLISAPMTNGSVAMKINTANRSS